VIRAVGLSLVALAACGSPPAPEAPATNVDVAASASAAAPIASTPPEAVSDDPLLAGIGSPKLTPRERETFGSLATSLYAPCANVATTVATCVVEKRACSSCVRAAQWIARNVRAGRSNDEVAHAYKDRWDPSAVRDIPIDGSPVFGHERAKITIVEFADFECPACGAMAPGLEEILAAHPNDVRFVFKEYPLSRHVHGEPAARAAIAAGAQWKFWEMHHALFTHQEALDPKDVDGYARGLGLDMKRFAADEASPTTADRIARDRRLGDALGVDHTPTIYIDGRYFEGSKSDLEARITEDLK
jgi:protein-disulfide isomerase